jgi:hypothetical protein
MKKGAHHSEKTKARLAEATHLAYKRGKLKAGKKYQFKKGEIPWNKGLEGFNPSPETCFKEGQFVGKEHPSWKGGIQHITNDCVHLWAGCNKRVRRPRIIYKKYFGKIPKGFIVFHKDGDKENDDPNNLIAISRAELLEINNKKRRK